MENILFAYASQLNADGVGDAVRCCNCGREMLIGIGSDDCPACKSHGCLEWLRPGMEEATAEDLKKTGCRIRMA